MTRNSLIIGILIIAFIIVLLILALTRQINLQKKGLKVFSFSLYGKHDKYCIGMIRNVQQIKEKFPGWQVWIYVAPNVPVKTRYALAQFTNARTIPVNKGNMIDRFMAIDDPRVEIMMVRDADSRIHDRDAGCIRDFENDPEKSFHIIRDQNGHWYKILGGMWGIKRKAFVDHTLPGTMKSMYQEFINGQEASASYGHDQDFLAKVIYPKLLPRFLLVHDEKHNFEGDPTVKRPFPVALSNTDFVGQSYHIGDNGQDVAEYRNEDFA